MSQIITLMVSICNRSSKSRFSKIQVSNHDVLGCEIGPWITEIDMCVEIEHQILRIRNSQLEATNT